MLSRRVCSHRCEVPRVCHFIFDSINDSFLYKTRSYIVGASLTHISPSWMMYTVIITKGINCSWDSKQHKHLNILPLWWFSNCAFLSTVGGHYPPVAIWSYHTVVKQMMCYLCVWHSKCQCLVWLMDFFWHRGGWDFLVSPCELQAQWTKWFLSGCYYGRRRPRWWADGG